MVHFHCTRQQRLQSETLETEIAFQCAQVMMNFTLLEIHFFGSLSFLFLLPPFHFWYIVRSYIIHVDLQDTMQEGKTPFFLVGIFYYYCIAYRICTRALSAIHCLLVFITPYSFSNLILRCACQCFMHKNKDICFVALSSNGILANFVFIVNCPSSL